MVFTSSPLLLDRADRVVLIHDGEVAAVGLHRELVHAEPRYRAVVTRETEEEAAEAKPARGDGPAGDQPVKASSLEEVLKELEEIEESA